MIFWKVHASIWPGGVTVSTPDSESGNRGSNLRRAFASARKLSDTSLPLKTTQQDWEQVRGSIVVRGKPRLNSQLTPDQKSWERDQTATYFLVCVDKITKRDNDTVGFERVRAGNVLALFSALIQHGGNKCESNTERTCGPCKSDSNSQSPRREAPMLWSKVLKKRWFVHSAQDFQHFRAPAHDH